MKYHAVASIVAAGIVLSSMAFPTLLLGAPVPSGTLFAFPDASDTEVLKLETAPTAIPMGSSLTVYGSGRGLLKVWIQGRQPHRLEPFSLSSEDMEDLLRTIVEGELYDFDATRVRSRHAEIPNGVNNAPGPSSDSPIFIVEFTIARELSSGELEPIHKRISLYAADAHATLFPAIPEYVALGRLERMLTSRVVRAEPPR